MRRFFKIPKNRTDISATIKFFFQEDLVKIHLKFINSSDPYYADRVKKFLRNYLGYEAWWFPSILYVTSCRFKGEFTPERAYKEYKKLVSISDYGAILYGESEKGKSLWESHVKFLKEFEKNLEEK